MNQERMMKMKRHLNPVFAALLAACLCIASPAVKAADERESLEQLRTTTLSLIELLVQEGVLSKSKADALIREAEAARKAAAEKDAIAAEPATDENEQAAGSGVQAVRVQYVPEHVKEEMREDIKKDVMAKLNYKASERLGLPTWIDRIQWEGDLRLRYELNSFPLGNAPAAYFQGSEVRNANIDNTTDERQRFRVRARLGTKIKLSDWLDGGIQMTTGSATDPISANQTLETEQSKFSFGLDRAFLRMTYMTYETWASVSGGRIENPWLSTDLVWDPDLAFDGVAAKFKPRFSENWWAFGTLGAFSLDEQQSSETNKAGDKWLLGAQAGFQWKNANESSVIFGAALYDFRNVEGTANPLASTEFNNTALSLRTKGNSTFSIDAANGTYCGGTGPCGLASKFRELNLTGQIDLAVFNPVHVIMTADYVRNIGFDENEILARTGNIYEKENKGYRASLIVGMPKVVQLHDWQVFGAYKRIEADAVLDAFTDSDFHLGGTDAKGWILGASYGVGMNAWLTARWLSADEISGLPLATDVLQLDLNAKF